MRAVINDYRSFDHGVRLLLINQLTINIGFYMLMPYLAGHLSTGLGLAAWLIGLVLGVRNLSQQGMFFLGGSLADRFGYKPLIVAGCALRAAGFGLLAVVDSPPALIAASVATGFAGALFNPAVRAYLASDAGERRLEAFALFNTFYQAGILIGPLIGLVLTGIDFRLTAGLAAVLFAGLTMLQARALPVCSTASTKQDASMLSDWRTVLSNQTFLMFAAVMIGSYVLSFQVYLALPLEIQRIAQDDSRGMVGTAVLFAISGLIAVLAQVRLTAWCKRRLMPVGAMRLGLALMGLAFVPLAIAAMLGAADDVSGPAAYVVALTPALLSGVLLTLGTIVLYPFEMDTIVSMAGGRLVATHYGIYNTLAGMGITIGNLGTGAALDISRRLGVPILPWLALVVVAFGCVLGLGALDRAGQRAAEAGRAGTASPRGASADRRGARGAV